MDLRSIAPRDAFDCERIPSTMEIDFDSAATLISPLIEWCRQERFQILQRNFLK